MVNYERNASAVAAAIQFSSLAASEGLDARTIICDNSQNLHTELPAGIEVLSLPNPGYAGAVNAGVAAIDADVYVVVTHEVVWRSGSIANLVNACRREGVSGAGPILVTGEDDVPFSAGKRLRRGIPLHVTKVPDASLSWVDALDGACWAFSRATWTTLGPLDEQYFLYWEETDWFAMARSKGYRALLAGNVIVRAAPSADASAVYYLYRNRYMYLARHVSTMRAVAAALFEIAVRIPGTLARVILTGRPIDERANRPQDACPHRLGHRQDRSHGGFAVSDQVTNLITARGAHQKHHLEPRGRGHSDRRGFDRHPDVGLRPRCRHIRSSRNHLGDERLLRDSRLRVGHALTRYVADLLAHGRPQDSHVATRTAILLLTALGLGTGLLVVVTSPWIVSQLLDLPPALDEQARVSFALVGISVRVALVSSAFVGVLESYQRFDYVNAVRVPYSTATFIIPGVLVAWFGADLVGVVLSIVLVRIVTLLPYAVLTSRVYQGPQTPGYFSREAVGALVRFGGWLTISNLAAPFLLSSDRFVIAATVSVAAAGIYTAPYEVAIRLLVVPIAISGVTFAAVAGSLPTGGRRPGKILAGSLFAVCAAMLPLVVTLSAFSPELLERWLGPELGRDGVSVFQVSRSAYSSTVLLPPCCASVLAGNRADWAAKLHVAEVPVYLAALVVFVPRGGIIAAAIVWTVRVILDGAAVALLSHRVVPIPKPDAIRLAGLVAIAVVLLVAAPFTDSTVVRLIECCAATAAGVTALRWAVPKST